MKNCPGVQDGSNLIRGYNATYNTLKSHFAYEPEASFHMESTVLNSIPKHEKRVIRILNLKIVYQNMIFSFDKLRKCNDYKR